VPSSTRGICLEELAEAADDPDDGTMSDTGIADSELVVWELEVRDPLGIAADGAAADAEGPARDLAASLGCTLTAFWEDADGDNDLVPEAPTYTWAVRIRQDEHRRRDKDDVPVVVASIRRELQSLLPPELGDWRIAPDWGLTQVEADNLAVRDAYPDLLGSLESALLPLRADGAGDHEPQASIWARGDNGSAGTYSLWLCEDPDFSHWLILHAGVAPQDGFWDSPAGTGLLRHGVQDRDPVVLLPRPAAPVWMASLSVGSFSKARLRSDAPGGRVPGALHQWTSGDPAALAARVSRDLQALLPRLGSPAAPDDAATPARAGRPVNASERPRPASAENPQVLERLAHMLARKAGTSRRAALAVVTDAAEQDALPALLDPDGIRQALGLLQQRHAATAATQDTGPEPRYYRLAEIFGGRLRPGVPQKTAKAQAAGVLPVRYWDDYDPVATVGAVMLDNDDADLDSAWWQRVVAAGARPDAILPDPYHGHRSAHGGVPLDRALADRDATGYSGRRYELDLLGIVRREPRDVDAWAHLGNERLDRADPDTLQPPGAPEPEDQWRRSWTGTALGYYQAAVAIAELALPDPFTGLLRWGHLDNRPFFRALFGLATAAWKLGRFDEAEQVLMNMLWLNPEDNQGACCLLGPVRARIAWKDAQGT
jgi:hypothetical protein